MLSFLTDEQISYVVVERLCERRPDIPAHSLHTWRGGTLEGMLDEWVLAAATQENLTLVTYDLRTIPPLLESWSLSGKSHAGVVLVDQRSIPQNDYGGLTLALSQLWDESREWEWRNAVRFLRRSR